MAPETCNTLYGDDDLANLEECRLEYRIALDGNSYNRAEFRGWYGQEAYGSIWNHSEVSSMAMKRGVLLRIRDTLKSQDNMNLSAVTP